MDKLDIKIEQLMKEGRTDNQIVNQILKESLGDKFNKLMGNDGDVDLDVETANFSDEELISQYNNIEDNEAKYPKWTPRGYQIRAINAEMSKRGLLA